MHLRQKYPEGTRIALACAAVAILCLAGCSEPPEPIPKSQSETGPPNVVLVVIDTLRADRIEAERNGVLVMPRLAALARESWRFRSCYAQATWTKPSVVSILTSLYPGTHRVQFGIKGKFVEGQDMRIETIPEGIEVISSRFQSAGYATFGIQTNHHLRGDFGFGRGFDHYRLHLKQSAESIASLAVEKVRGSTKPFFLYVHFMNPHAPYFRREPHFSSFGEPAPLTELDRELLDENNYGPYYLDKILWDLGLREERQQGTFSRNARKHIRQLYDSECCEVDKQVGRMIDRLKQISPNTIVVVTSDHGEEFWEHESIGHAITVYEELAHVPLIVHIPGQEERDVPNVVETIDIVPTLAALAGLPANGQWQGRSLVPVPLEPMPAISQTRASIPEANLHLESLRDGPWKLIVNRKLNVALLFDLENDPAESRDVGRNNAATRDRLFALLDTAKRTMARHPAAKFEVPKKTLQKESPEDQELLDGLNALGYLQGSDEKKTEGEQE